MNMAAASLKKFSVRKSKKHIEQKILHAAEEFKAILKKERARADRVKNIFSLVVFELNRFPESRPYLDDLMKEVSSRIRIYDEIGWFDDYSIGILLPDTPPDGAWKFAEEIKRKTGFAIYSSSCAVYRYPSLEWTDKNTKQVQMESK